MTTRERIAAIRLIELKKRNPKAVGEMGVTVSLKNKDHITVDPTGNKNKE